MGAKNNGKDRRTAEERAFHAAKSRCTNPNDANYYKYGARGIEFLYKDILQFVTDVGPRPGMDYSLDRIDNNSHYMPGNCKWATYSEQAYNRRRVIRSRPRSNTSSGVPGVSFMRQHGSWRAYLTVNGKTKHLGCFPTKEAAADARNRAVEDALNSNAETLKVF